MQKKPLRAALGQNDDKMNINKTDSEKKIENLENDVSLLKKLVSELTNKLENMDNVLNTPITMRDGMINKGVDNTTIQIYNDKVMTKVIDLITEVGDISRSNLVQRLFKSFLIKYLFEEKRYYLDNVIDGNNMFEDLISQYNKEGKNINYNGVDSLIQNGPYSGDECGKKISVVIEKSIKSKIKEILNNKEFRGGDNKLGQFLLKYFFIENKYIIEAALFNKNLTNNEKDQLAQNIKKLEVYGLDYDKQAAERD